MQSHSPNKPMIIIVLVTALAASVAFSGCCGRARVRTKPCLAIRGCPAPEPLPRCRREVTDGARTLADLLAGAPSLVGDEVTVRSTLLRYGGICTLLWCAEGSCCNRCTAGYAVSTEAKADSILPHTVSLVNVGQGPHPHSSLICVGDESLICCPLAEGMEVVVTGRFAVKGESAVHGKLYSIESPQICMP